MLDEQHDTSADDVPEGAVSAEDLKDVPDAPDLEGGDNMAGPRAAAEERAKHAAESAAAKAAEDAELRQ